MNKEQKKAIELLEKAYDRGLFDDIICPKCEMNNMVDYKNEKVNASGVWYYCKNCGWLDVIGWDIIKETAKLK